MVRVTDWVGEVQMVTGVAHLSLGVAEYRQTLAAIAREGGVGVVQGDQDRELAVWFLTSGAGFLLSGSLARWAQRRTGTLPAAYGYGLLALGLAGGLLLPPSGFWVVAANGLLAVAASRGREMRDGEVATS